jgi:glutathione S-transferase
MIKILGKSTSINVRKVLWTCTELDLPYDHEEWGEGYTPLSTPAFVALNPLGQVPVLIDGDFVTSESNAIIRYLANAYDPAGVMLPQTPRERAKVERWMDWQASELNNAWRFPFMSLVRRLPAYDDPQRIAANVTLWTHFMSIIDAQLMQTGEFFLGDTFCLADIVIGLSVHRWYSTPIERPSFSAVQAYYDRLSERPGFRLFGRNGMP